MKNTRLKNVIFTAGMAIFTGVLLLGVNAAIGAATPTVDPPGAGVSPTFTGLDVRGAIVNAGITDPVDAGGVVFVDDDFAINERLSVTGESWLEDLIVQGASIFDGNVTIDGDLETRGGNFRGVVGNSDGNFYVDDNMTIDGTLNLTGNLSDSFGSLTVADDFVVTGASDLRGNVSDSTGSFTVGDNFIVTGTSNLQGNVSDSGGDFTVGDNLVVTGTSNLQGNVSDSGGDFTVGDNLAVTGTSNLQGNVSDSGGDFTVGDNLVVTGTSDLRGNVSNSTDFFTIDDDVIITSGKNVMNQGSLEVWDYAGFAGGIHMDLYETQDNNLTGVNDIVLHGEIRDSTATEVTINDGLTVIGAAKASRFGTYDSNMQSTGTLIPKGGGAATALSMACSAGQTLVSCGIDTGGYNMDVLRLYPWDNNTCYAHVRNTDAYNRYAWLVTMCLDPDA